MTWDSENLPVSRYGPVRMGAALLFLLAPALMLGLAVMFSTGPARSVAIGVSVTLAIEGLYVFTRSGAQKALSGYLVVAFYFVAALVLRFNSPDLSWFGTHVMLALSILMGTGMLIRREVVTTGSNARRVKFLISRLLARKEWPLSFEEYRCCPMIQSLREALGDNAAPVLPLLAHDDVRVQMAALTVLEFHPIWRKGQAEAVLQRAAFTEQPAVRAAALLALANVVKSRHLHGILPYLCDPTEQVRRAATVSVLWDAAGRWNDVRGFIRGALAAPHAAKDGPLPCSGSLPPAALEDLVNWAMESGAVGKRSTQTLIRHCKKAIHEDGSPEAIARVSTLVANPKVPAAIRVELAHRLQSADAFPVDVAMKLLGHNSPTMLRVLAAGAILSTHQNPEAIEVLREAAKQPNREITLAAASLVQKYLGVDLGLAVGGKLPETNSREAAEIARKVQNWAIDPGSVVDAIPVLEDEMQASGVAYF